MDDYSPDKSKYGKGGSAQKLKDSPTKGKSTKGNTKGQVSDEKSKSSNSESDKHGGRPVIN